MVHECLDLKAEEILRFERMLGYVLAAHRENVALETLFYEPVTLAGLQGHVSFDVFRGMPRRPQPVLALP